jgi:GAF domain-containing protein
MHVGRLLEHDGGRCPPPIEKCVQIWIRAVSLYRLDGDAEFALRGFVPRRKQQDQTWEGGAASAASPSHLQDLDPNTGWSSMEDTSLTLVTSAVRLIPGAEIANLSSRGSLLCGPHLRVVAGTSLALRALEDLQVDSDQGPSILAARTNEIVTSPELQADRRWPEFAAEASSLSTSSVLAVPLVDGATLVGVLSLYAATAHAFTERALQVAGAFAAPAALVVRGAQRSNHARFPTTQERLTATEPRGGQTSRPASGSAC